MFYFSLAVTSSDRFPPFKLNDDVFLNILFKREKLLHLRNGLLCNHSTSH